MERFFGVWLSLLLVDAGLGARTDELRALHRKYCLMLTGLAANILCPVLFLTMPAPALLAVWHNPVEAQAIVAGLSLVAVMPVAGSSVTWIQSVHGGLGLGIARVLASTLLSPWSGPWALHTVNDILGGDVDAARFEHAATTPEATALMLSLAMTNNGTGLTLAGTILPSPASLVLLPLLCHNLIQHLVAAGIAHFHRANPAATRVTGASRKLVP